MFCSSRPFIYIRLLHCLVLGGVWFFCTFHFHLHIASLFAGTCKPLVLVYFCVHFAILPSLARTCWIYVCFLGKFGGEFPGGTSFSLGGHPVLFSGSRSQQQLCLRWSFVVPPIIGALNTECRHCCVSVCVIC